jgi:hypothetical protein
LLSASRTYFGDHAEDAKKLVEAFPAAGIEPAENAAWVAVTRILLNMDEFITRE